MNVDAQWLGNKVGNNGLIASLILMRGEYSI